MHSARTIGLIAFLAIGFGVAVSVPLGAVESVDDPVFDERATLSGNYLAARIAGSAGDSLAAARFYSRALSDDPDNPVLLEQVFLNELSNGNMDAAIDHAEDLVAKQPTNRMALFTLALKDLRGRNFAAARQHIAAAQSGTLADLTGGLMDGWALYGLGRTEEAIAVIEDLSGPDWYGLFKDFHLGLIYDASGRTEEARQHLSAAYAVESGALRVVETMARFEARHDNRDEALRILAAYEKVLPDHPNVTGLRQLVESGEPVAPMAMTPIRGAGEAFIGLGLALAREGGEDIATIYLRKAAYALDNDSMALAGLADVYERQDRHVEAIAAYDLIAEDAPVKRSAETKRALNLDAIDQTDEAIAALNALIASDTDDREPIMALGNILRARERFTEAARTYTRIIDTIETPVATDWLIYYYRGIANERSKRWPAAEKDLQQALELSPDHPLVLNYLGYSWVDQGIYLEEGLEMIKKAVAQRPRDGYIVDSLGWVYYRLGRFEEAVANLERAVELRPQDPVINDHLGDAYWMVGRKLEARFQWSHARDLDPEPAELEKIEAKLKHGLKEPEINRADNENGGNGG